MLIRRLQPADAHLYRSLRLRALREHPDAFTSSYEDDRQQPVEAAAELADDAPGALDVLEAGQDRARLMGCLGELQERTSGAIRAAFFEGRTYAELADGMAVPLGTMKSWVRRGLMKLKECLER